MSFKLFKLFARQRKILDYWDIDSHHFKDKIYKTGSIEEYRENEKKIHELSEAQEAPFRASKEYESYKKSKHGDYQESKAHFNIRSENEKREKEALSGDCGKEAKSLMPVMKHNYKCLKPALKYFKKLLKNSMTHEIHKIISKCGIEAIPYDRIGRGPGGRGIYNMYKDFRLEFSIFVQVEGGKFEGLSEPVDWFCMSFSQHDGWYDNIKFKNELDAFIYLIFYLEDKALSSLLGVGKFKNPVHLIIDFVNWS